MSEKHLRQMLVNWKRIFQLFWKTSPRLVFLHLFLALLIGIVPGFQVHITSQLIESAIRAVQSNGASLFLTHAIFWVIIQGVVSLILMILEIIQQHAQGLLQMQLACKVNLLVMEKALALDIQQFEDDKLYDCLQRVTGESAYRPFQAFTQMVGLGTCIASLLSVATLLFSWSWLVALVILLSPLPIALAQIFFAKRRYAIEWGRSPEWRRLSYLLYLSTNVRSCKEIRLFRLGPLFLQRYGNLYTQFYRTDKNLQEKQMYVNIPLGVLRVSIALATQLYALVTTVANGNIGILAGYLQAVLLVQQNAQALFQNLGDLYRNSLYIGNLFEFLNIPSSALKNGTRPFPKHIQKGIEFRHISFCYPGTFTPVLHDVSFLLPAGSCIALVGHNGAGKTTISKLLLRLYEPTEGHILIDDIPVEEYDLEDLRKHMSILFQDFIQYEMSVYENIGFGNIDDMGNLAHIQQAATASGASAIITQLPQQYETQLGRMFEKGHELSVGQWQKIALARTFLRKASIVVLDEPTASIDAATEANIFSHLQEVTQGATTLIIAHRFSTVRIADRILVMERGRVIEEGTHEQLLQAQGTYFQLFSLQAAGYQ